MSVQYANIILGLTNTSSLCYCWKLLCNSSFSKVCSAGYFQEF